MKSEVEDWLTELPPLDGDDDEPDPDELDSDDIASGDEGERSLDDASADDLEIDEGAEIADEQSEGEDEQSEGEEDRADEQRGADVGEADLDLVEEVTDESLDCDPPSAGEGDVDLDEDMPSSSDDAGEEGTTDPIENSLDQDLPALDADDEGDFEDTLLFDTDVLPPPALGWAEAPWTERKPSPRDLAWAGGVRAELSTSIDARFSGANRTILAGYVRPDGTRVALARASVGFELLASSDGVRWFSQPIAVDLSLSVTSRFWLAEAGAAVAIGDDLGVVLARDGRHFLRLAGSRGAVCGTFAGATHDAPLLLAGAFGEDETNRLVRASAEGAVEIVADLGVANDDDDTALVWAIAWDDTGGVLRVARAESVAVWAPGARPVT
ncbi:MAG TPA: hypothetical protein VJT73_05020 [Polyangiaceae bacterium]|nr:hypothetical protein [Polyangiaceae bacterium]